MLPSPYLNLSWNIFAPTPSTGFGSPRLAPMLGSPSMSPISLPIVPGQPTGLFVGQWIYSTHSRPTCLVPLLTPRVVSLLLCCRSTITTSSSTFAVSWLALLAHPLNPPCSLLVAYPPLLLLQLPRPWLLHHWCLDLPIPLHLHALPWRLPACRWK